MGVVAAPGTSEVLLFGWDGGGNVPPLLALGRRLVGRGHRVRMVCHETAAARAGAAGIDFSPFGRSPSWAPAPGRAMEEDIDRLSAHLVGPELGDELLLAVTGSRPDVVVIDCMAGGALSMAEHLAIPTVVLVHLRARFHFDAPASEAGRPAKHAANARRRALGLDPLSEQGWWGELWQRAGSVYIASVPELEGPGAPLPASFTYVGGIFEPDPSPLPDEIAALVAESGAPLVATSLSTSYMHQERQLRTAITAVEGRRGVVTVGAGIDPACLPSVDRVVVTCWLSHEALFPHVDVVVTHAGHGTILAALDAGVPLVCLPMGRDQHGNAEQVERAGAGVVLDSRADAAELRAAIDLVLADARYAVNARRLGQRMARLGGGDRLAREVEHLAPSASVPPRGCANRAATRVMEATRSGGRS